jgi:hypothetical protein
MRWEPIGEQPASAWHVSMRCSASGIWVLSLHASSSPFSLFASNLPGVLHINYSGRLQSGHMQPAQTQSNVWH